MRHADGPRYRIRSVVPLYLLLLNPLALAAEPAALAAEPAEMAPAPAEAQFLAAALTRGLVARKDGAPSAVTWAVRTGAGHALGAVEFAQTVSDNAGAGRIVAARRGGTTEAVLLASVGATLEMIAIGFLIAGDNRSSEGEDLLWRGAALAGTGAMPLLASVLPARAVRERERWPALYYTPEQADALIATYNAKVRQEMALPSPTGPIELPPAAAIEQAPPTPPEVEDAPVIPPVDGIPEAESAPDGAR